MSEDGASGKGRYALITAAYNEEAKIGRTIDGVLAQTSRPVRWVIVSDGSTDRTDEVVCSYEREHPFIRFVRREKDVAHDFAAKVRALQSAQRPLEDVDYEFIGVLDADVLLADDYFERVMEHFRESTHLGIGGGNIVQIVDGERVPRLKDARTVAGAVQFFRRRCFEETGGFLPLRFGGEDAVIEVMARMRGWEVRTFLELEVDHLGLVGSGAGHPLRARARWGRMNRAIGYHPIYQLARSIRRAVESPFIIGSLMELCGYARESMLPSPRIVPSDVVSFLRTEQLATLRGMLPWLGRRD